MNNKVIWQGTNIRLTNGTECFACTVTATDEQGPAELMDSNGAKYYRDDYNGGWTSDAAEESVTAIEAGETDEAAKERLLLEGGEKCEDCAEGQPPVEEVRS